jgi:hypothetical protein
MNRALNALLALLEHFFETAPLLGGFGPGGQQGSCRSREQYSINAHVIGAAVSMEFAEREKAKAAKKTAAPRPGVDGLPPSGSQPKTPKLPVGGLNALSALKEHTSPRCGGGLGRLVRLKSTLPPRCGGGLRRIRRLKRTLPPRATAET